MPLSNFDIKIAYSVEEIGREAWDCLAGDRPFASYRWYRFGEAVLANDMPLYIVLSREGATIARATFWLKRQETLPISSQVGRYLLETLLRRWPLMVCRTPLANTSGLILPDSPWRSAALETIAQVAQEQAQQRRVSFLVFDYLQSHETRWTGWPEVFIPTTIPDPGTRLSIIWSTFEEYLKHVSKSMRKDYRRHCNRAADLGIEVKAQPTVTATGEALALVRNVERHHNSPPNPLARMILEKAGMVNATWLTAEIEGRLVGCGLLLADGDVAFLGSLGIDYDVRYTYFQLVYGAIRWAIEGGLHILRGGSGAYELKQRLGFQLENDNYVTFTANGRGLRWVGRQLAAS